MKNPQGSNVPRHIAVIMDGNGRWAKSRFLPRTAGHRAGAESVKCIIEEALKHGVKVLTLFAFSSENWDRPKAEVDTLMGLFLDKLHQEMPTFKKYQIQVRVVGDLTSFSPELQTGIQETMNATASFNDLVLVIAASYGGRWDIIQATKSIVNQVVAGELTVDAITEDTFGQALSLSDLPEPDLLIRTSGEQRISNFLLWQLAYTEFYFTPVLWPDFSNEDFKKALEYYQSRQRRYGLIEG